MSKWLHMAKWAENSSVRSPVPSPRLLYGCMINHWLFFLIDWEKCSCAIYSCMLKLFLFYIDMILALLFALRSSTKEKVLATVKESFFSCYEFLQNIHLNSTFGLNFYTVSTIPNPFCQKVRVYRSDILLFFFTPTHLSPNMDCLHRDLLDFREIWASFNPETQQAFTQVMSEKCKFKPNISNSKILRIIQV